MQARRPSRSHLLRPDEPHVIPDDGLAYMTRARQLNYMIWLITPFLYYAIHNAPNDRFQQVIQSYVERALEYAIAIIKFLSVRHRHHGILYGFRTGATASFQVLAARKVGHNPEPFPSKTAKGIKRVQKVYLEPGREEEVKMKIQLKYAVSYWDEEREA